jgi:hypothetical protein
MGGLVMGLLSALPLIQMGNACCCLWVVTGGVVAAYLLQQNSQAPITAGEGAVAGLLAGIVGAVVQTIISIPVDLLMAPIQRAMLERAVGMAGPMPPGLREMADSYLAQSGQTTALVVVVRSIVGLFFALFVGVIFSTLGGLLGASIFRKPQPPGSPDSPSVITY